MAEEQNSFKFLFVLLLIFLAIAFYYTGGNLTITRSAMEDSSSFFDLFLYLSNGDVNGFLDHLGPAMSFMGLFLIIFVIVYFLFTTVLSSIFRSKRLAFVMSAVITIYSFINPTIYNYLVSLNAFGIAFIVFVIAIMIIWGSSKEWYGYAKEDYAQLKEQKEAQAKAKKELEELRNSF